MYSIQILQCYIVVYVPRWQHNLKNVWRPFQLYFMKKLSTSACLAFKNADHSLFANSLRITFCKQISQREKVLFKNAPFEVLVFWLDEPLHVKGAASHLVNVTIHLYTVHFRKHIALTLCLKTGTFFVFETMRTKLWTLENAIDEYCILIKALIAYVYCSKMIYFGFEEMRHDCLAHNGNGIITHIEL